VGYEYAKASLTEWMAAVAAGTGGNAKARAASA